MKTYRAVAGDRNICTVWAVDEASARAEVTRQLDRAGRRHILREWHVYGEQVIEKGAA